MILGDLLVVRKGQAYDARLAGESGPYLLGMGVFDPAGGFRPHKLRRYAGAVRPEGRATAGTVVVAITDMGAKIKILGRSAKVPEWVGDFAVVAADMGMVEWRTDDPIARSYAYWVMRTDQFRRYCLRFARGTAVRRVNPRDIELFPIPDPNGPHIAALVAALEALDAKIDQNQRINETLEAIIRSLFTSWFVNFDPVRAKMERRNPGLRKSLADLFPSRLIDSELGEIPEGWEVGAFADVVELLRDTENPLESPDALFEHFSIPSFDEGQRPKQEFGAAIKSLKSRVPPGVVLLSKLNPEIERVWLVDVQPGDRAVCSTEFLVLSPRPPHGRAYTYCLARSPWFRQQLESLVTGTSKSHQRAQVASIVGMSVVRPAVSVITCFEREAEALLSRALECRRETKTISGLRDTLLPRLISGELRTREAEPILRRAT